MTAPRRLGERDGSIHTVAATAPDTKTIGQTARDPGGDTDGTGITVPKL